MTADKRDYVGSANRRLRRFDLVDSALLCEVIFGMVVTGTFWLVLLAVYGLAAFILAVLVAFGAAMWATGLALYAMKRSDDA